MSRPRKVLSRLRHRRREEDPAKALARATEKIIVSAGMMRSGSTWLFNALRLLLEREEGSVYAFWVNDYRHEAAGDARHLVVKIHGADAALAGAAWRRYTCHRDLRDVAVSLQDMDLAPDRESQLRVLQEARDGYDFWAARADLDIPYQRIVEDGPGVLAELSADLGMSVAQEDLASIAASLSNLDGKDVSPEAPYDPVTLVHRAHRFDGRPGRYVDSLDPEAEELVVRAHGDWLRKHGYL